MSNNAMVVVREMVRGMPSFPSRTLYVYLERLHELYGENFNPFRALEDLEETIKILKEEIQKWEEQQRNQSAK